MIGFALKKLAKEHNLTISDGVAFGNFHDYAVTFFEDAGTKTMAVTTKGKDENTVEQFLDIIDSHDLQKEFRILEFNIASNGIIIVFHDNPGTMKKIFALIDFLFPLLKQYQFSTVEYCTECGLPITSHGSWHLIDGIAFHMHEACAHGVQQKAETELRMGQETNTGTYGKGFLGALLGALLGSVVWAIVLSIGYVASVIGFVIGLFAKKGYELFHGRHGKGKLWILLLAVIIGVVIGTFLGDALGIAFMIIRGELPDFSFKLIFPLLIQTLMEDAEYARSFFGNMGAGLIFALLGIVGLIRNTHQETKSFKMKKVK